VHMHMKHEAVTVNYACFLVLSSMLSLSFP